MSNPQAFHSLLIKKYSHFLLHSKAIYKITLLEFINFFTPFMLFIKHRRKKLRYFFHITHIPLLLRKILSEFLAAIALIKIAKDN